jgi:hypothetical protein
MLKQALTALLISTAITTFSVVSSSPVVAATMDYQGAWSNTVTYATGRVVIYNKGIYYSLRSSSSGQVRKLL